MKLHYISIDDSVRSLTNTSGFAVASEALASATEPFAVTIMESASSFAPATQLEVLFFLSRIQASGTPGFELFDEQARAGAAARIAELVKQVGQLSVYQIFGVNVPEPIQAAAGLEGVPVGGVVGDFDPRADVGHVGGS